MKKGMNSPHIDVNIEHYVVYRTPTTAVCVLGAELGWELFDSELYNMFEHFLDKDMGVQYSTVSCKLYSRANIKGSVYHSLLYKRATKQNSYTVKYACNSGIKYGQIKYFISVSAPLLPNDNPITICAMKMFDNRDASHLEASLPPSSSNMNLYLQEFFVTTSPSEVVQFVKAEDIVSPCIKISVEPNTYIMVTFPNRLDFISTKL